MLLVQCIQGEGLLYLWDARASHTGAPRILHLPNEIRLSAKADARWVRTSRKAAIFYGDMNGSAIVWPDGREPESPQLAGSEGKVSDDDDDDSLYDILSGKTTSGQEGSSTDDNVTQNEFEMLNGSIQDTFDFRRGVSAY